MTTYTIPAGRMVMVTKIPGADLTTKLGRRWDGKLTTRTNTFTQADVISYDQGAVRFRLPANREGWTALIAFTKDIQTQEEKSA